MLRVACLGDSLTKGNESLYDGGSKPRALRLLGNYPRVLSSLLPPTMPAPSSRRGSGRSLQVVVRNFGRGGATASFDGRNVYGRSAQFDAALGENRGNVAVHGRHLDVDRLECRTSEVGRGGGDEGVTVVTEHLVGGLELRDAPCERPCDAGGEGGAEAGKCERRWFHRRRRRLDVLSASARRRCASAASDATCVDEPCEEVAILQQLFACKRSPRRNGRDPPQGRSRRRPSSAPPPAARPSRRCATGEGARPARSRRSRAKTPTGWATRSARGSSTSATGRAATAPTSGTSPATTGRSAPSSSRRRSSRRRRRRRCSSSTGSRRSSARCTSRRRPTSSAPASRIRSARARAEKAALLAASNSAPALQRRAADLDLPRGVQGPPPAAAPAAPPREAADQVRAALHRHLVVPRQLPGRLPAAPGPERGLRFHPCSQRQNHHAQASRPSSPNTRAYVNWPAELMRLPQGELYDLGLQVVGPNLGAQFVVMIPAATPAPPRSRSVDDGGRARRMRRSSSSRGRARRAARRRCSASARSVGSRRRAGRAARDGHLQSRARRGAQGDGVYHREEARRSR